ncbi:MAG: ChrR family anti-sigma-E factor [Methylococcaceae bacterium]
MNKKHHPNDASMIAYAAGALDPSMALVVSSHLEACSTCQNNYQLALNIGGTILEQQPNTELFSDSFDQLWDKVLTCNKESKQPDPTPEHSNDLPKTLAPHLPTGLEGISWQQLSSKIHYYSLPAFKSRQGWVRLFKFLPGAVIPVHSHQYQEMSLVLQGGYADELGSYYPGDLSDLDNEIQHSPVITGDTPCIALIATEGNLHYKKLQHRLTHWCLSAYSRAFSQDAT